MSFHQVLDVNCVLVATAGNVLLGVLLAVRHSDL